MSNDVKELENLVRNYHKLDTPEAIKLSFQNHLKYTLAKDNYSATEHDRYYALAMTVRDRLIERWIQTSQTYYKKNVKRVYYLSMEYLIGRSMGTNVLNLRLDPSVDQAMKDLGLDWEKLRGVERDAGLGNGGLGRLAACFLDSMATMELPGYGYGVRYDYGIFRQIIKDGYQLEEPDNWLRYGSPWEIERPEYQFGVRFGGNVVNEYDNGRLVPKWVNYETLVGIPYDLPIAGYGNNTVNNLRLWTAKAAEEFDLKFFNNGDYVKAYERKTLTENITKVLYPNDLIEQGRELRFKQQYFFVSCSIQDIVRRFKVTNKDFRTFPDMVAIQLNDTHPAMAVAELMRLLLDVERMEWDEAWDITQKTMGYTNHTLMPESLERWSVRLFEELLPRHLSIIYEINRRFLRQVMNKFPNDPDRVARMSLIQEGGDKQVRMAYLSVAGSHSVNGVAALHSDLLKSHLFKDFFELWPHKFNNKTNGITQRRWLLKSNPGLADLVTERIGDSWITDLYQLKQLESAVNDSSFKEKLHQIKRDNKVRLCELIKETNGVVVDPDSIFDTQVKRLHEYKRQVLNVLHIIHRYFQLKDNPQLDLHPRTFIFAAKAAPGYYMAKLIIKLINDVAGIVNNDPDINGKMKLVFLSDYRVSLAERIIPATDLSEQISTAGTEASGTGNMKFALNGAITIGTLDGANIEIREEVGADNFFLFGKTNAELEELRRAGAYNPWDYYHKQPEIKRILDALKGGFFDLDEPALYQPIYDALLTFGDRYFHLADFQSYVDCQQYAETVYRDRDRWLRMSLMNIANTGKFSSDRTIQEYSQGIWHLTPCHIDLHNGNNA
ncbi:MAG TPA: glycogen phosphorylase [Verrucomicrobia bacterium]|nr:MAG: glycogen phosphorylase [Lentisphaerae bacterium GWF2_57_35]HBA85017.1 glycogen phosphorylase [Verrucomicrobiota bacterium]